MGSSMLARWFPVPRTLAPLSAGVDISDSSVRWIAFENTSAGVRVRSWGEEMLKQGAVVRGVVQDAEKLVSTLKLVKQKLGGIECAHASLPEESAYVFGMRVPPHAGRAEIMNTIGFELETRVPIPPSAAVYDFDPTGNSDASGMEIGVYVFAREVAEGYAAAFEASGLHLLSLELEARSIARAACAPNGPVELVVDFGRERTGFAIVHAGVPIFTSTVTIGGETMTRSIMHALSLSADEARAFNDEHGLEARSGAPSPVLEAIAGTASSLCDEILRHYRYWDSRRNEHGERVTPVERVLLVGGGANLRGLDEYVSGRVQASVVRPNIWRNVCSFDEYIPPINRAASLQFATAAGLALRGIQ